MKYLIECRDMKKKEIEIMIFYREKTRFEQDVLGIYISRDHKVVCQSLGYFCQSARIMDYSELPRCTGRRGSQTDVSGNRKAPGTKPWGFQSLNIKL